MPTLLFLPLLVSHVACLNFGSKVREPRVLFVIESTDHPGHSQRVPAQLSTWAKGLRQDELLIGGRRASTGDENRAIWEHGACPDNHKHGLVCKEAMLVARAHRLQPDWAVIANDDHYIVVDRIKAALAKEDPSKPQILGIEGCVAGPECSGMCGGGTLIISRAALNRMLESGEGAYQNEEMQYGKHECKGWSDQSTSAVAKHHGVELRNIGGLKGWRWKDAAQLDLWLHTRSTISMHYVTPADMAIIDRRIASGSMLETVLADTDAADESMAARVRYISRLNRCQYSNNAADFRASDCDA